MTQETEDRELEALLDYLRDTRGFDFTGYKRGSLGRRISMRMEAVGLQKYSEYLDYLQVHPDEFEQLFNYILINVTGFFRDPQIWDYLGGVVFPRIIETKEHPGPIRVWCAGVASGEEAYSVAMLLAEGLGVEGFAERVKIYATDVDEDALATARQGTYSEKQVEPIPPALLNKYFERVGPNHLFDKDLRRSVIFGRHDLVQDAPISKIDLLVCRNTLMYFNSETQARILEHFQFALNEDGFLLLGKAEMLFTHIRSFTPLDLKRRVFTKAPMEGAHYEQPIWAVAPGEAGQLTNHIRSRDAAFELGPVPQIVIDRNGYVRMVNEKARSLFDISPKDVGRPFKDLEISYHPVELRSRIQNVANTRQPDNVSDVKWSGPSGEVRLDIEIVPLVEGANNLGAVITFEDISRYQELQEQLERSNQELETAMEELQSTNEELETTNEELQSTNEELETTNEELQSTNEELETMNEELQSTNEELQTVNDELLGRGVELTEVNSFLESILSSVQNGVVVVDNELRIKVWNDRARDLWGLGAEEVMGRSFLNLDIGLPVSELKAGLLSSLDGGGGGVYQVELDAVNRRGRAIRCRVTSTPRHGPQGEVRGLTIQMEELDHTE
jgi:two-component system CheB/CheR fusion protein